MAKKKAKQKTLRSKIEKLLPSGGRRLPIEIYLVPGAPVCSGDGRMVDTATMFWTRKAAEVDAAYRRRIFPGRDCTVIHFREVRE